MDTISAGSILVFQCAIDFYVFLLKNRLFDPIFRLTACTVMLVPGQTYKGEYNYQHPAVTGRPVMQLGILGVCLFCLL